MPSSAIDEPGIILTANAVSHERCGILSRRFFIAAQGRTWFYGKMWL
ncbi:hypothetical protein [Thiohalophilus sp.]|nr:hypothetical protein [Thiohalophilus sp.]MDZ7802721.1 hypothetical protein [Thiohalophilus sp.]